MNCRTYGKGRMLSFVVFAALIFGGTSAAQPRPWLQRSISPNRRAELLVGQMTLDEKILEIHMLDTREHPREVAGIERLGIPAFKITNGPAGAGPGDSNPTQPATALPAAIALAASWDTTFADTFGYLAAEEVKDRGEDLIEGPGVNIARIPQNGRNFEYFGEDPFLAAHMAVSEIRALQSDGVIAEVKHFAANNQEIDRKSVNEIIDERTLREIYLPAFEAAVTEANVGAVMAAYPSINGQFGCENVHLLKDILRGEWGFKGFVQSDYTATKGAVRSAQAGLDLSMKHDHYGDEMKRAVLSGQVPESAVDSMLVRRFSQMFQYGLFDNQRAAKSIAAEEHGRIARSIAEHCAVLLKNDGNLLPLQRDDIHSLAVFGPYAGEAMTGGRGSSQVKPLYTVSPIDGIIHHMVHGASIIYNDGSDREKAAVLATSADVAIVMVGNKDGEGADRQSLSLPGSQDSLVFAVASANPRTVVILKTGGAVLMPWLDRVRTVLEVWYPGEEDGNVVADLVFGIVNPSGKLPLTFPQKDFDVPANKPEQYPGVQGIATYSENLLVGYRWYDKRNITPLFPFGFGLSYTTFSFANLDVSPMSTNGEVTVTFDLTNIGSRQGQEVAQVYVSAPRSAGEPPKQLKGFAKTMLQSGETKRLTIILNNRAFSVWDASSGWRVVPGTFGILVGDSSRNLPLTASIIVP